MEKIRSAYAWARAHRRLTITLAAMAGTYASSYIPGFPTEKLVSVVSALLVA